MSDQRDGVGAARAAYGMARWASDKQVAVTMECERDALGPGTGWRVTITMGSETAMAEDADLFDCARNCWQAVSAKVYA